MKKEQLYLKMSKCEFGKTCLVYSGHIVGGGELKIDPSKVDVILNWPRAKTVTEVRIIFRSNPVLEEIHC